MDEIDFDSDSFGDIVAKDPRYHALAYSLLMDVVHRLNKDGAHCSGADILDEFKETALDQYGPLAYTVLTEWGLTATEDIGEMMLNLVETHRVMSDDNDKVEDFACGYDFKEAFLGPYEA